MGTCITTDQGDYLEYRLCGEFNNEELIQTFRNLWQHPDYSPDRCELYDFTEVNLVAFESGTVPRIADLNLTLHKSAPQLHIAVLVADNDLHYGISRMGAGWIDTRNPNLQVFRNRDEAVAWVTTAQGAS